ncbi:MAG: 30S ribosomal protein S12 methylthiotransferase RimO [Acidobacteria bacterium]|nr:MAG: 30S ribosomal protein S12 methylthiotransferase RimO [Acidobacteriota bacterium]
MPSAPRPTRATPRHRKRVFFVNLGCPKNQVDGERILGRLEAAGAEIVGDPEAADTLIVNTCAFIDAARAESVDALLDAAAWKEARPGRRVIAAGCLVQRAAGELVSSIPELDGLLAPARIESSEAVLGPEPPRHPDGGPGRVSLPAAGEPRHLLSPPHSVYVKIAEGCDQSCAFCAIPAFRGRQRSRRIEDVVREVAAHAAAGAAEVNLIAQDSTGYGRDLGLREGLAQLIEALDGLAEGPPWVRIHYLYPGRISDRLVEAMARSSRVVEYVDLPLQHADPEILRRMRRPGSPDAYLELLDRLRAALPGAGVRSGFIVGFPGETDAQFERLCRFVEQAGFDAVGVFAYSHEEGTAAASLRDDIPAAVKLERKAALEEIAAEVARARNEARVGQELEVLVDGEAEDRPGWIAGRWRGQAPEVDGRVLAPRPRRAPRPGERVRVRVTSAGPAELIGRIAGEER